MIKSLQDYTAAVVNDVTLKKPMRVAIDCGNGVTSVLAANLFRQLGCEVSPLFCELDGRFPNHSPDPTEPENLVALQALVVRENLDLGIAFDGDGDRVIAVDGTGEILWPDKIMLLLAQKMLQQPTNNTVVCDVKCSYLLKQVVEAAGGTLSLCPTGHSHLKRQVRETGALLGGEFSGHIILRDRWSDFDDGLYAAARLLETLSQQPKSCASVFASLPNSYSTPDYRLSFHCTADAHTALKTLMEKAQFEGAQLCLIDGLRVDYADGWGLMRASNTSAALTFRFEAATAPRLEAIKASFRHLWAQSGIKADLPF